MHHTISKRGLFLHFKRFRAFFLLFAFLAGFLSQAAPHVQAAQSPNESWIELAVPMAPGGDVVALAIAPSDSIVMYSLLQGDPEGLRLFRSQDAGQSWQIRHIFSLSAKNDFNQLTANPDHPQIVFASGGTNLQRSTDGGVTWEILSIPGDVFTAVSSDLLYAGGRTDSCGYGKVSILARSEDGGQSWENFNLGCLVEVQQIAVLPSQPDVVYLSVLYYSAHTGTVLKSTDSGETWTTLVLPVGGADFQLLIDPENPQRLFASGLNGILGSLDGGETWQQISNQWMTGYFALAFSGGSLFAISKTGYETSVYRTDDGGEIWWSSVTPLPAGAYMLQPDPTLPGNLWAGLFGYGVYHTANGGGSWVEQNSGISTIASIRSLAVSQSNRNVIYATLNRPYTGVYRSLDGGQSWGLPLTGFKVTPGIAEDGFRLVSQAGAKAANAWYPILEINNLLVHPQHPEIAWAATSRGIYETTDGVNWSLVLGVPSNDLTVSPGAPDEPYAAGLSGKSAIISRRICDSSYLQCYWIGRSINSPVTIDILRADHDDPNHLLMSRVIYTTSSQAEGIFQSLDGGSNWQQIGQIDVYGTHLDLAIDPQNRMHIIATLDLFRQVHWFFRSLDGGVTWQDETLDLPVTAGMGLSVAIDEFHSSYLGTENGVFQKRFSQTSWQPIGLQGQGIYALDYYPGSPPFLFAAGGTQLWRLDLPPIQRTWLPLVGKK